MTVGGAVGQHRVRQEADAAWERYASTVRLGGTTGQRRWAFDKAMVAEERARQHDRVIALGDKPR